MGELKKKASHYPRAFEGTSPLGDEENRARKAAKIQVVLEEEHIFKRQGIKILGIGCSFGIILRELTPADGVGIGVDIDQNIGSHSGNVVFARADAEVLPFASDIFDIVICNHVYEHTDDAQELMAEINRILKDYGVCYFAGPNKYEPIEPHYGLPFLSWLPRRLADSYMRLTKKGTNYPEKPYSRPELQALLSIFNVTSYTEKILYDPVRYNATDILPVRSLNRYIAIFIFKFAPFFFPGFVYILRKNSP